ncbi:MAG: hypothetical protein DRJ40_10030 [Thermoprotei archaeon]|nr:MAG: hypothetical protein DRJ40_10030 [Thermoprotei archaeon]
MSLVENGIVLTTYSGERILVVADLHIGYERELALRGARVPLQHRKLLSRLTRLIKENRVDEVILLGDVKHTVTGVSACEVAGLKEFLTNLRDLVNCIIVQGNHDGDIAEVLPEGIKLVPSRGLTIRDHEGKEILLLHGHAKPRPEDLEKVKAVIIGHVHPHIYMRDSTLLRIYEPVFLKVTTNKQYMLQSLNEVVKIIVLPPFNTIVGGTPVENLLNPDREHRTPLLKKEILENAVIELYLRDGTYIGTLSEYLQVLRQEEEQLLS